MRVKHSLLVGTAASLTMCPPVAAFAPSSHVSNGRVRTGAAARTSLRSTVDDEKVVIGADDSSWNIGAVPVDEAAKKKEVAKMALNRLLERQRREMQQTMDLIENLDYSYRDNSEMDLPEMSLLSGTNKTSLDSSEAPTIASSVAAGADYGFISRSEGCRFVAIDEMYLNDERFEDYGPPSSVFNLGSQQFMRNARAMFNEYKDEEDNPDLTTRQRELQAKLDVLTLNSTAIWEREEARGPVVAPYIIKIPYYALCYLLDVVFEGRNAFSRFFLLETVARMPYFSYITMLHLYETLGFWRRSADVKRIHFAEEWNEFHHLMIMESLGGDQPYWVRFLAQHSAIAYYIALSILWMASPTLSYKFSEMLETHAVDTYGQFIDENAEALKKLPPSLTALEYYTVGVSDPMFGEYQTSSVKSLDDAGIRKPGLNMRTLYDVFLAIRADEGDHVSTMKSCLDPAEPVLSPGLETRVLTGVALAASVGYLSKTVIELDSISDTLMGSDALDAIIGDVVDTDPFGGIVNFFTGMGQAVESTDADEATGSAVGEIGGITEGLELEAILDILKAAVVAILEIIGVIL